MLDFANMKPGTMLLTPEGNVRRFQQYITGGTVILELIGDRGEFRGIHSCYGSYADSLRLAEPPQPKPIPEKPLALLPRHCWIDRRISEIMRAIIRYEDDGKTVPQEWIAELLEHLAESKAVRS